MITSEIMPENNRAAANKPMNIPNCDQGDLMRK
jgi:hypothetical protein